MFRSIIRKIKQTLQKLIIGSIKVYRLLISPYLGQSCRFHPSCSAYAIQAIAQQGLLKAVFLIIKRVLKCNPWSSGGYDPVPSKQLPITDRD
jgi:uncharacterized protein